MSAYIVSKEHIRFLIESATSRQILASYNSTFRWYFDNEWHELPMMNRERLTEVGNMLWLENIKSVSARYPNESSATLPGPVGGSFVIQPHEFTRVIFDNYDPIQVLKACDCYAYQTCEHDSWKESESCAFIEALRHAAWHALPGYEKAAWGAPKTIQEKESARKSARFAVQ